MKICYLADINSVHTQKIIKHFAIKGHEVHILAVNRPNFHAFKYRHIFKTYFIGPIESGPKYSPQFIWNQVAIVKRIKEILKELNPDILHCFFITDCGFYGALSGFHPLLIFAMGSDIFLYPNRNFIYRAMYKYVLKRTDFIHCETMYARNLLCRDGLLPNKIKAFPLGIDLNTFRPEIQDKKYLRLLGLTRKEKIVISTRSLDIPVYSVDTLIHAIPHVIKSFPEANFIIVGSGRHQNSLKELANKHNVSEFIHFLGFIPNSDISKLINISDIYISTSLYDTFSISTLEAMACSKPVIVTDLPGTDEWIKDGWNGLVFPKKDHFVLAEKIEYLMANPKIAEDMGRRNREIVEKKANILDSIKEIQKIYKELI